MTDLDVIAAALDGMDAAGGDRDGMPECPWCHSDGTWHDSDCGLALARLALARLRRLSRGVEGSEGKERRRK